MPIYPVEYKRWKCIRKGDNGGFVSFSIRVSLFLGQSGRRVINDMDQGKKSRKLCNCAKRKYKNWIVELCKLAMTSDCDGIKLTCPLEVRRRDRRHYRVIYMESQTMIGILENWFCVYNWYCSCDSHTGDLESETELRNLRANLTAIIRRSLRLPWLKYVHSFNWWPWEAFGSCLANHESGKW
jgi:hypothetical protein